MSRGVLWICDDVRRHIRERALILIWIVLRLATDQGREGLGIFPVHLEKPGWWAIVRD